VLTLHRLGGKQVQYLSCVMSNSTVYCYCEVPEKCDFLRGSEFYACLCVRERVRVYLRARTRMFMCARVCRGREKMLCTRNLQVYSLAMRNLNPGFQSVHGVGPLQFIVQICTFVACSQARCRMSIDNCVKESIAMAS